MEQVQEQVNDQNENVNVESQEQSQAVDVEALMARIEKLESTNTRLLDESKTNKGKYQNLRNEVDTKQKTALEESENWKELLEIEKNKAFELQENNKKIKQNVLKQKLNFEVARHAKNAFDVTDVINSLDKNLLSIDEESLEIGGIKEAVESVMNVKPHLFNTGVKNHGQDGAPPAEYKVEKKEQSLEEILAMGAKSGLI
jgi:hypothetical protein